MDKYESEITKIESRPSSVLLTEGIVQMEKTFDHTKTNFLCFQVRHRQFSQIHQFVAVFSYYMLSYVMMEMYLVAVITTLEKRFGLTSQQSGLLLSIKETAFLCTAMFVSHFAKHSHRPRVLAFTGLCGSMGGFLYLLPHFVYGSSSQISIQEMHKNYSIASPPPNSLCKESSYNSSTEVSGRSCGDSTGLYQKGALVLFAIGSVVMGVSASPQSPLSTTYVDDATTTKDSAFYLGMYYKLFVLFSAFHLKIIITGILHYK